MRPDQRWFPTNRTERAAWFQNFTNNFAKVAAILGFSPAEVAAVQADNDMVQFLNTKVAALKNYVGPDRPLPIPNARGAARR